MPIIGPGDMQKGSPLPGWEGRFFHSENMTFAHWTIAADAAPLHEHHHPNEEVWNIIDGTLVMCIEGEERSLSPGDAAVVPPDVVHSVRIVEGCRALVTDYPLRLSLPGTTVPE